MGEVSVRALVNIGRGLERPLHLPEQFRAPDGLALPILNPIKHMKEANHGRDS
jgi:hypothetical protein